MLRGGSGDPPRQRRKPRYRGGYGDSPRQAAQGPASAIEFTNYSGGETIRYPVPLIRDRDLNIVPHRPLG